MKTFDTLAFKPTRCREELDELGVLLDAQEELEERNDVLSFFRKRRQLSAFIGSYPPYLSNFDRIAYEYDLFGDFKADLVIGDSSSGWYCFVEFEDASSSSVFKRKRSKVTSEWSSRLEHGFSQVVDWFWKLSDMENSREFMDRFGRDYAGYEAIIVVGRQDHLDWKEQQRLRWRRDNVMIGSKHVHCVTFDELFSHLDTRLSSYEAAYKADQRFK